VGPATVQRALNILKILCVVIMEQKITFSLTEDTTETEINNLALKLPRASGLLGIKPLRYE
jgi:hypothetical protein